MTTDTAGVDIRGNAKYLALGTLAFAMCFSAWGMLAPLAPKLEKSMDLSNTETSIMIAIPVVLGSLLRLPFGAWTDRYGGRSVFGLILVYAVIPPLMVGFFNTYPLLLVAGFFLGVVGASFAVGVPYVSEWYPQQRQGLALGVYGIGNIGTAVSAFSVPFIYTELGRPAAGIIYAASLGGFALLWWGMARNAPIERHEPPRYLQVLRSGWEMWRLSIFYFVTFGGFVAMAIFLPKLLVNWFDFSLTNAGMRAGGFTIVATAARPFGGWLADRIGGATILPVVFVGVAVDAGVLAWQSADPRIVPVTIACLTMAAFLGTGNGAVFKLVPQFFAKTKGAVTGIVGAAGGLGGFFPPLVLGIVKDATGSYALSFVFLVVFAVGCTLMAMELHQRLNRRERQPLGGEAP